MVKVTSSFNFSETFLSDTQFSPKKSMPPKIACLAKNGSLQKPSSHHKYSKGKKIAFGLVAMGSLAALFLKTRQNSSESAQFPVKPASKIVPPQASSSVTKPQKIPTLKAQEKLVFFAQEVLEKINNENKKCFNETVIIEEIKKDNELALKALSASEYESSLASIVERTESLEKEVDDLSENLDIVTKDLESIKNSVVLPEKQSEKATEEYIALIAEDKAENALEVKQKELNENKRKLKKIQQATKTSKEDLELQIRQAIKV